MNKQKTKSTLAQGQIIHTEEKNQTAYLPNRKNQKNINRKKTVKVKKKKGCEVVGFLFVFWSNNFVIYDFKFYKDILLTLH